jgi:hypothetical protein
MGVLSIAQHYDGTEMCASVGIADRDPTRAVGALTRFSWKVGIAHGWIPK